MFAFTMLFFGSLLLVVYHHLVYPLVLVVVGLLSPRREPPGFSEEELPSVAIMIAARNEEGSIAAKLENTLQLDYPRDRLRIILLANGCTDRTVPIARRFADRGVEIFEYGEIGKDPAQNLGVERVDSEIIVFSDANNIYEPDAIRHLVKPFSDPKVGAVSGKHVYSNRNEAAGAMEGAYWGLVENFLKRLESRSGGALGVAGSIYAIRRDRFIPVPPGTTSDFYGPILIAAKGYRTEYAPKAVVYERAEQTFHAEYRRRVRIIRQSVYGLRLFPWLLNPFRTGRLAWVLWSHKVLRWFEPFLLLAALLASTVRLIFRRGGKLDLAYFLGATFAGFLGLLGRGLGKDRKVPVISHVYYILIMFQALIKGVIEAFRYGGLSIWGHDR